MVVLKPAVMTKAMDAQPELALLARALNENGLEAILIGIWRPRCTGLRYRPLISIFSFARRRETFRS